MKKDRLRPAYKNEMKENHIIEVCKHTIKSTSTWKHSNYGIFFLFSHLIRREIAGSLDWEKTK